MGYGSLNWIRPRNIWRFVIFHCHNWPQSDFHKLLFSFLFVSAKWKWSRSVVSNSLRPMDCSPPSSSVHRILQARILEWVSISFSRGSSQPRDRTQVSHIAGRCFNLCTTREAPIRIAIIKKTRNNKYCWRCREKGTPEHCWWGYKLVQMIWKQYKDLSKNLK